jgi:septum formation protein
VTPRLVLASASPRRHALLAALGLHFDVIVSGADEDLHGTPEEVVVVNARAKRDDVARRLDSPAVVIAADTLVFLEGAPLGKPAHRTEAAAMLKRLSGNTHQVITGISIMDTARGAQAEGFEKTDVTFRDLKPHEIDRFIEAVNPIDRAGAYTVDGPGSLLIAGYCGCYQNVLGLPIVRLDFLLRDLGYNLFDLMDLSNCSFL